MSRPLVRTAVLAALAALSSLTAACSGADDPAMETADTTAAPAPESTTTTSTTEPPTTTTTAPSAVAPVAAKEPKALAAQATQAERDVRDPNVTGDALLRAGWTQQVVGRALAIDQSLLPKVLPLVPDEYRAGVEANAQAAIALRSMTKPGTKLPPWRIVDPAPADELLGYYKAAEAEYGVPWSLLASIHFVETKLGRIRGTSTAGAQGPMQFMPATWGQYGNGGDINSNRDAIFAAARLLKRNGAPQNIDNAVFNYNRDRRYVSAVKLYAEQMAKDERAYRGYYQWQVYYRMPDADRVLLVGYPERPAIIG